MGIRTQQTETTGQTGQLAENLAAQFLEQHGLKILTRNYRCKGGEIDLIAHDGKILVFAEVRLRRSANFGGAGASITLTKQRRIILAAQHYLLKNAKSTAHCRFDCLLLNSLDGQNIEWLCDAFSAH